MFARDVDVAEVLKCVIVMFDASGCLKCFITIGNFDLQGSLVRH